MAETAPFIRCNDQTPPAINYGFFGRQGGVSTGLYDSLNCGMGSDDDKALVQENRAIAAHSLGMSHESMARVYQVHSADIVTITSPEQLAIHPKADGLVTSLPEITLSILTADCTPVLFYDASASVIGACHAGWRGAASGIIQNTVSAMCALGADAHAITCMIGPTIAKASYQTGHDMRDEVLSLAPQAEAFFEKDPTSDHHFLFDLPAFAQDCARQSGLSQIFDVGRDTYGESSHFFSHRRATHRGETDTGRQIALITKTNKKG